MWEYNIELQPVQKNKTNNNTDNTKKRIWTAYVGWASWKRFAVWNFVLFVWQVAKLNGHQGVGEIFYHVGINFNSGTGYQLSCFYDIGFRLVETKQILDTSSQNNCIHLLLYKPSLIPDFQFGKGSLPSQIDPYVIIKFLKELLTSTAYIKSCLKASDIEELHLLIRNLEEKPVSKMFVRSSFPWHGG